MIFYAFYTVNLFKQMATKPMLQNRVIETLRFDLVGEVFQAE